MVVAMAGSLANPYGAGLFNQNAQVKSASTGVVLEWQHLDPSRPADVAMFVIGIAALTLAVRRRDIVFTAALSVTSVGPLAAIRILPILVVLALPVISAAVSHPAVLRYARRMRLVLIPGAAIGLASVIALAAPSLGHIGRPVPGLYPAAVVQKIPRNCHLVNSYALGGFVLLLRPDVSVSIDSRNDLYGSERVVAAERLLKGDGDLDRELGGAGCVLVPPSSGLAKRLSEDPQWQLRASEPTIRPLLAGSAASIQRRTVLSRAPAQGRKFIRSSVPEQDRKGIEGSPRPGWPRPAAEDCATKAERAAARPARAVATHDEGARAVGALPYQPSVTNRWPDTPRATPHPVPDCGRTGHRVEEDRGFGHLPRARTRSRPAGVAARLQLREPQALNL